jgi:mycothiol synthase
VSWRALTEADFESVAGLLASEDERLFGRPSTIGITDVRTWLGRIDLASDSWLCERDGRAAALGWVQPEGEVGVAIGVVHAGEQRRGLGGELVDRAESRLREIEARRVHQVALAPDACAAELFGARGYVEVRRFWDMAIEFDREPPAPTLPDGLRIETFTEAAALPFYDALEEAFEDHWEHHRRPFEEWWSEKRAAPDYDPTLWFLVRDGSEIAAVTRNDPFRSGGGWIGALGVRRAWRGCGLGKALLLHSFREFHRRGIRRVSLGVDAENPTGATRLYESAGMHVESEQVVYEKRIG